MAERILVVDDQRTSAELVAGLLRNLGYEVSIVLDGPAALARVREAPPDLLISDIMMPGMDGYEVCRRLRADPVTALLPVILVTSAMNSRRRPGCGTSSAPPNARTCGTRKRWVR